MSSKQPAGLLQPAVSSAASQQQQQQQQQQPLSWQEQQQQQQPLNLNFILSLPQQLQQQLALLVQLGNSNSHVANASLSVLAIPGLETNLPLLGGGNDGTMELLQNFGAQSVGETPAPASSVALPVVPPFYLHKQKEQKLPCLEKPSETRHQLILSSSHQQRQSQSKPGLIHKENQTSPHPEPAPRCAQPARFSNQVTDASSDPFSSFVPKSEKQSGDVAASVAPGNENSFLWTQSTPSPVLGTIILPCRARGMPVEHNFRVSAAFIRRA